MSTGRREQGTGEHKPDGTKTTDIGIGQQEKIELPTISAAAEEAIAAELEHIKSHVSQIVEAESSTFREVGDEIYDRLPKHRKVIITCILSLCGFLAPMSSTMVLPALPNVADTFNCSGSIVNLSNALYLIGMGLSPMFWGPIGQVYGRRWVCVTCGWLFTAFSIGTALSPNLASFFVFRMFTAFQGTAFLIVGASCLGDIYRPTERGTAYSWFLGGALIGPAFGPLLAGVIITYRSWRDIFWLQSSLAGLASVLLILLLPETIHSKRSVELKGLNKRDYAYKLWQWTNPFRVIRLYRYLNLLSAGIASSALVWNMYSLLTPIRYVLNPRFHLTSPMQAGLFYIAPGCGYLAGTLFGGRWADYTVKKYIRKHGKRIPEDRLRACLPFMGIVMPACMLVYGWSVEKKVGGVPLPVIMMFIQGVAQLFCFPSINTYCVDVMQQRSGEVVAGNYAIRYLFAAAGTAVVLPATDKIGVGWFSTISASFLVVATLLLYATSLWGRSWADRVDEKKVARKASKESFSHSSRQNPTHHSGRNNKQIAKVTAQELKVDV
ncbi:MAG: hypothetical protein M1821_005724 [Bathelium mastoideum]|nr:MAG: hypothetical protein M1821_005724 [Bathelium mastoideum]